MRLYTIQIRKIPSLLTYQSSEEMMPGSLVEVPFRNEKSNGIVINEVKNPDFECHNIGKVLISQVLSPLQLKLCEWMSEYYCCTMERCLELFLPSVIWVKNKQPKRKDGELKNPDQSHPSKPHHGEALTEEQEAVLEVMNGDAHTRILTNDANRTYLIHGVTGSGKTEIYLQLIKKIFSSPPCKGVGGSQVLLLVPEIALTTELIQYFSEHFPNEISIVHSRLSDGQRTQTWYRIFEGKTKLILGSRSALFTPWKNLGAIILDEEHEWTYKNEQAPRYHARTVAEKIVELTSNQEPGTRKPVLLLGSATPSVESYYRATQKTDAMNRVPTLLSLTHRANFTELPKVTIVDLRQEFQKKNLSMISDTLHDAIVQRLVKKEQMILFLNKRGASSSITCRDCGFTPRCKHCDLALTFHLKLRDFEEGGLLCHSCGAYERNLVKCPNCSSSAIRQLGTGTQKAEGQLRSLFPTARILRADKDTTSGKYEFEEIYHQMRRNEADILLGTQMVAKGLDLPNVTLTGILIADIGLHIPSFRSNERVFQLLMQVAGRSGRHKPGEVILQTYQPEHPAIQAASQHDFDAFYQQEIKNREQFFYPPFCQMIRLTYAHEDAKKAKAEAEKVFLSLRGEESASADEATKQSQTNNKMNEIASLPTVARNDTQIDLSPHFIPKLHGKYLWNILIRGENPRAVIEGLELKKGWKIDVDPL